MSTGYFNDIRDELDNASPASASFVRISPPEDGLCWELGLDLSQERGREICRQFCLACDESGLDRIFVLDARHRAGDKAIIFRPSRGSGATLSLKECGAILMQETIDGHFDPAASNVVAETLRRAFPQWFQTT